ncbi:hypothetical protein [Haloterrigena gelatinilytica]|nr:hypothetical protein [Haloterrigena gelatinilytica]
MDDRDEERWLTSRQAKWLKRLSTVFVVKMLVLGAYLLHATYLS